MATVRDKIAAYTAANSSTMQRYLQNHHGSLLKSYKPVNKTLKGQTALTNAWEMVNVL